MAANDLKRASKDVVIRTSNGYRVRCKPIATKLDMLAQNIAAKYKWPEPPVRIVVGPPNPDGSPAWETEKPMVQEYIDSDAATDEQKAAWAAFTLAYAAVSNEHNADAGPARIRMIAIQGVELVEDPGDDWVKRHEFIGLTVPEGDLERQEYFFLNELLGDFTEDLGLIMTGIMKATGFDKEMIADAEASFRNTMERIIGKTKSEEAESDGDTGETTSEGAGKGGLVEQ